MFEVIQKLMVPIDTNQDAKGDIGASGATGLTGQAVILVLPVKVVSPIKWEATGVKGNEGESGSVGATGNTGNTGPTFCLLGVLVMLIRVPIDTNQDAVRYAAGDKKSIILLKLSFSAISCQQELLCI